MPEIEIQQNTIDEVISTGRELIALCEEHFMPTDGKLNDFAKAVISHRVMMQELAGEL